MKIGIAQIRPVRGDMLLNIEKHKALIGLAASLAGSAVFFPELSLTGYEPTLAKSLATTPDDARLDVFQSLSNSTSMFIGVGLSTVATKGIRISMVIFQPSEPRVVYSKQELHPDEFPYFVKGNDQLILPVGDEQIAPAICYESLQPQHSQHAVKMGATVYVATVAKSQNGIRKAFSFYPELAKNFSIPVLMSNCVGFCDNFDSVGTSSVWSSQGELVGQFDDKREGVLVYDTESVLTEVRYI